MSENNFNTESRSTYSGSGVLQFIGRFITAAIVLGITAFFTPGFQINNLWTLAIATLVLTGIDFLISKFTGLQSSPFGKGFVGFILSAITLYITQYFVAGYTISWISAIIGALIYGIVDYLLPGNQHM